MNAGVRQFDDFAVSSFDHPQILTCLKRLPEVKRGLLWCGIPLDIATPSHAVKASFVGLSLDFINSSIINHCQARGLQTWVYTANALEDFKLLQEWGVDGIFTDYPKRLLDF